MPFGIAAAAVGAAGAIGGAYISSQGAKTAAQDQENAAENATQAQLQMFNTTQGDYANQIKLGAGASTLLENLFNTNGNGQPNYAAFNNSPGYKFSVQQGDAAIDRQAAASGGLYSTNTLGALSAYNTGQASQEYNSYVNQLMTAAGIGNAAASGVGTAATATGQGVAASTIYGGNAAAQGAINSGNAFSNALQGSGLGNLLGNYGNSPGSSPLVGANNETFGGAGGYDAAGNFNNYNPDGTIAGS
jgi:hypothetical protein